MLVAWAIFSDVDIWGVGWGWGNLKALGVSLSVLRMRFVCGTWHLRISGLLDLLSIAFPNAAPFCDK